MNSNNIPSVASTIRIFNKTIDFLVQKYGEKFFPLENFMKFSRPSICAFLFCAHAAHASSEEKRLNISV